MELNILTYILLASGDDYNRIPDGFDPNGRVRNLGGYNTHIQTGIANKFLELANQYRYGEPESRQNV